MRMRRELVVEGLANTGGSVGMGTGGISVDVGVTGASVAVAAGSARVAVAVNGPSSVGIPVMLGGAPIGVGVGVCVKAGG